MNGPNETSVFRSKINRKRFCASHKGRIWLTHSAFKLMQSVTLVKLGRMNSSYFSSICCTIILF